MGEQQDNQNDIKNHDQIKKRFIREQLKPQRHKTAVRLISKGILVLCAAVLFGGISALSFYIMRINFPWDELDESIAIAPARVTSSQAVEGKTVSEEMDPDLLASLEGFEQLSTQLAQVGSYANAAIVKLDIYDLSMSRDHRDAWKCCGILFHETSKSYYILTEYAMAQSAQGTDIPVTAEFNGKSVETELCGSSEKLDLAIFSVEKSRFSQKEQENIVIAELGDNSNLKLGSAVLVVGKPNGKFYSVDTGLVTNTAISVLAQDRALLMYTMNLAYQENRAGFVLNMQGQLVGMLSSKYKEYTGEIDTAFLVLSYLETDLNQMIRGQEVPSLGIYGYGASVSEASAENLNSETNVSAANLDSSGISGIFVEQVVSRSPAYKGGMRVADVITEVDGQLVENMEQLHEYLATCKSGQEITVVIKRGNPQSINKKLKITLQ